MNVALARGGRRYHLRAGDDDIIFRLAHGISSSGSHTESFIYSQPPAFTYVFRIIRKGVIDHERSREKAEAPAESCTGQATGQHRASPQSSDRPDSRQSA